MKVTGFDAVADDGDGSSEDEVLGEGSEVAVDQKRRPSVNMNPMDESKDESNADSDSLQTKD